MNGRCIRQSHVNRSHLSYCNRVIEDNEWCFVSIDHAYNSIASGDSIKVCPDCRIAIIERLNQDEYEEAGLLSEH